MHALTAILCLLCSLPSSLSRDTLGQAPFADDDRTFTVDRLNRLTDTAYTATIETESQTLDRVGNRESHTPRGGSPTAYTLANAANEYAAIGGTGVTYDAAGNLCHDEAGRGYQYDEQNRLVRIYVDTANPCAFDMGETVLANYAYDALGRRVRFEDPVAGITTRYYYDGPNVIEERNGACPGPNCDVRVRYHVSGAQFVDEHVASFDDASGIFVYYVSNDLYTVAAIGSASGSIIESYIYGAYGLAGPASSPCIRGDMDGDSVVDAADLPQFITVLLEGTTDPHELCAADLNGDFQRDGLDIQPFVNCLLNAGSCPGSSSGSPLRSAFTLHGRPVDVIDSGNLLLQYNRARYYDIKHGRWLQRDRAGYRDGPSLYESFRNNPARLRDPLGEGVIDDILDLFYRYGTPEGAKQTIDEQTGVIPLDPLTAASRERERMIIGTLGPPAQKIAETARQVAVRGGGAVGAVGGAGEAAVGVVFFIPSFGASGVFVLHGADVSQAGVRQAATGEPVATFPAGRRISLRPVN